MNNSDEYILEILKRHLIELKTQNENFEKLINENENEKLNLELKMEKRILELIIEKFENENSEFGNENGQINQRKN